LDDAAKQEFNEKEDSFRTENPLPVWPLRLIPSAAWAAGQGGRALGPPLPALRSLVPSLSNCGFFHKEEKSGNEKQKEKELTFLEKHAKAGLMSKCGAKESKATVFMEMDAAAAAANEQGLLKRKRRWLCVIFFWKRKMNFSV
jgi:hypothetical protein